MQERWGKDLLGLHNHRVSFEPDLADMMTDGYVINSSDPHFSYGQGVEKR